MRYLGVTEKLQFRKRGALKAFLFAFPKSALKAHSFLPQDFFTSVPFAECSAPNAFHGWFLLIQGLSSDVSSSEKPVLSLRYSCESFSHCLATLFRIQTRHLWSEILVCLLYSFVILVPTSCENGDWLCFVHSCISSTRCNA